MVAGLNVAQPDFLVAYPSALHVLSVEARAGRLRIAPQQVLSCSEPLLPEIRAAAEEAWGVRVGNIWGMSEGGCAGVACEHARMHLSEDLVIVEPVDEEGRPVAPGERAAKIYLTNLFNRVLPLIRYEITDEVTILTEPCPCGSAHRCVADIQGRLDDVFVYDGRRVHPHVFRSALGRRAGVVEYQVQQTPRGAQIAVRCSAPVDLDGLRGEVGAGARLPWAGAPCRRGHGRGATGARPRAGEAQAVRAAPGSPSASCRRRSPPGRARSQRCALSAPDARPTGADGHVVLNRNRAPFPSGGADRADPRLGDRRRRRARGAVRTATDGVRRRDRLGPLVGVRRGLHPRLGAAGVRQHAHRGVGDRAAHDRVPRGGARSDSPRA